MKDKLGIRFYILFGIINIINFCIGYPNTIDGRFISKDKLAINLYEISRTNVLLENNKHIQECQWEKYKLSFECHHGNASEHHTLHTYKISDNGNTIELLIKKSMQLVVKYHRSHNICKNDDEMYTGKWLFHTRLVNISELATYCPIFNKGYVNYNSARKTYGCDSYHYASYYGKNNCIIMSIAVSLKKFYSLVEMGILKKGIILVGDSLTRIVMDGAHCELEHLGYNQKISCLEHVFLLSKPPCSEYCNDPNHVEHDEGHCLKCYYLKNITWPNNKPGRYSIYISIFNINYKILFI